MFRYSTVQGQTFTLGQHKPEKFSIIFFYRGRHCPICREQLRDIEQNYESVVAAGMDIVAVSMDNQENATEFEREIADALGRENLSFPVAYGLEEVHAREWGLFISSAIEGSAEPSVFSEPGFFVIRPDNSVFMSQVQSAPFTRPNTEELVQSLLFAHQNNYPVRGDLTEREHNLAELLLSVVHSPTN